MIQRVIYYYVPGIIFEGADLAEFSKYIHRKVLWPRILGVKRRVFYGGTFLLYHAALVRGLLPAPYAIAEIDQQIMDKFFLCTDFWDAPHTAGRKISLARPPDPYEAVCSNPLANTAMAVSANPPASDPNGRLPTSRGEM